MSDRQDDLDLLARARAGDGIAESALVERYLPLVGHMAARFGRPGSAAWDDIYGAGCLGLARALDRFDPGRGVRISTYAVPLILGEIRQFLRDGGALKIGRRTRHAVHRARSLVAQSGDPLDQKLTLVQLASEVGLTAEELALAMEAERAPRSLDDLDSLPPALDGDGTSSVIDGIALAQSLALLPEHLKRVILLRFARDLTQQQTGAILGLSQSQVSRREREAVDLLRGMLT